MFEQLLMARMRKRGDRFARVELVLAESRLHNNWQYVCNLGEFSFLAEFAAEEEVGKQKSFPKLKASVFFVSLLVLFPSPATPLTLVENQIFYL